MSHTTRRLLAQAALAAAFFLPSMAFGGGDVPHFDPAAPVDLDRYEGNQWPDEREVSAAFENQYAAFDSCVAAEKKRTGKSMRLVGDAGLALLLNPAGARPLGVNAEMPTKLERRSKLANCLRNASAEGPYPQYDGPPLVVKFEFELDPEWVEEEEA